MKKKLILTLSLLLTLMLLSGCSEGGEGQGGIEKAKEEAPATQVIGPEEDYAPFSMTDTALDYEFDYIKVGRAYAAFPYPKDWEVTRNGNGKILFTAPDDDPYFPGMSLYFHSKLEKSGVNDTSILRETFDKNILRDRFSYKGVTFRLDATSDRGEPVVNSGISDPDAQLHISYRIKDGTFKQGGKYIESGIYMNCQYFYWFDIPCVLAAATETGKEKELDDLLEYMFSNTVYAQDIIANTEMVKTGSIRIPVCPVYRPAAADTGGYFDDAYVFICPADSDTGFAQSSLAVYEIKKDKWIGINEESLASTLMPIVLKNAFGKEAMSYIDIVGSIEGVGSFDFKGGKVKEYLYDFALYLYRTDKTENFYDSQMWYASFYPVKNGDVIDLIVLVTPKTGIISTLDCIVEIAYDIKYE